MGEADVARRIDVIAMALQLGATVYDLEEAERRYAPQFGAAKDPVNPAGMIAADHLLTRMSIRPQFCTVHIPFSTASFRLISNAFELRRLFPHTLSSIIRSKLKP